MRKRQEIEQDGSRADILSLEVLLDIRDFLNPRKQKRISKKRVVGNKPSRKEKS
jgi:hypothetical protein